VKPHLEATLTNRITFPEYADKRVSFPSAVLNGMLEMSVAKAEAVKRIVGIKIRWSIRQYGLLYFFRKFSRLIFGDPAELLVDVTQNKRFDGFVIQARDDFHGESAGDELPRARRIDATCLEIENLFIGNLGGCGTVLALDLVRVDFKTGHGVRLTVIGH
jgi:hypothetical protein